jgi:hypothetical protein
VPLSPETRKEAEKRLTVLKMIEVFADKCPKSTLLNGPFGGDDKAFDRLLGPSGILTRTALILASTDGRVTHYSRTDPRQSLPANPRYATELLRSLHWRRSLEEMICGP